MEPLRAAIVGCGAVASIHARSLAEVSEARAAVVYGPDLKKAQSFAEHHDVEESTDDLGTVVARADFAIVCSPTSNHFEQTRYCLEAGLSVLDELPPCEKLAEVLELGPIAEEKGVLLQCAHTSRYIAPYRIIKEQLPTLGAIQQVIYLRNPVFRTRSWVDDPVLHHAAHPLDLMIDWFREVNPIAQAWIPERGISESVSLLARLPNGAPVSISISYRSKLLMHRLTIVGKNHTVEASGFGRLDSDLTQLAFRDDDQQVYEAAIGEQDRQFVAACMGKATGVPWSETVRLMQTINEFQRLRPDASY